MVDMVMEDLMEGMEDIEAMVVMDMERERLKLSQDMDMVAMVMEDLMEVMVDTEAMEVMVMERERLRLSQDMDMEVMDMEDPMEVMVLSAEPPPWLLLQLLQLSTLLLWLLPLTSSEPQLMTVPALSTTDLEETLPTPPLRLMLSLR